MQFRRYSVLRVAEHFLYLDSLDNRVRAPLTPMKLQKLLYYAQGYSVALRGEPLFDEAIEAWEHGPVVPVAYRAYADFGRDPIPPSPEHNPLFLDEETRHLLDMVQEKYGIHGAVQLRNMTHKELPYTTTGRKQVITIEVLREYFSQELHPTAGRGEAGEVVAQTLDDEEIVEMGEFTPAQRERIILSAITNEALEGNLLPREIAERAFEAALRKPLPNIG